METKNIILIGALGVGAYFLIRNRNKNDNKKSDRAIEENTIDSTIAQDLYSNLNVTSTAGRFHISLTQLHPTAQQYRNILNLALNIVSLKKVNDTFLKLTNGQYTLNQATSDAMGSVFFTQFWNYAKSVKVITTVDNARVQFETKDTNGNTQIKSGQLQKNVICGGLLSEDKTFYRVLHSVIIEESGWVTKTLTAKDGVIYNVRTADSKKVNVS